MCTCKRSGTSGTRSSFCLRLRRRCEQGGPDAKAEALLDWLYRLQAEEGDPELKVLVFTSSCQLSKCSTVF